LDVTNGDTNQLKSVLARLGEGTNNGEGTYLGVKSYYTQRINPGDNIENVKSFSIEHKFFGVLNNSINFYRGGDETGGNVRIAVHDGREICKFYWEGVEVNGIVRAREVKIETSNWNWPDFVFSSGYQLPSLKSGSNHIKEHKHLPGIPTEAEAKETRVNLGEMQAKLLQKIEELTLYAIQQQETIDVLKERIEKLENGK
jgi:hypothetical protein